MLSFDVRSLAVHAAEVDGALAPDDAVWMDNDVRPDGTVHVSGRLSVAGAGRFYFSGQIAGTVTLDCRRCLAPVVVDVADRAAAIFSDAIDEDTSDPDVFELAGGGSVVDLRLAVREQWLLNVPAYVECHDECRGLV